MVYIQIHAIWMLLTNLSDQVTYRSPHGTQHFNSMEYLTVHISADQEYITQKD